MIFQWARSTQQLGGGKDKFSSRNGGKPTKNWKDSLTKKTQKDRTVKLKIAERIK